MLIITVNMEVGGSFSETLLVIVRCTFVQTSKFVSCRNKFSRNLLLVLTKSSQISVAPSIVNVDVSDPFLETLSTMARCTTTGRTKLYV